jgi:hypothetical protein
MISGRGEKCLIGPSGARGGCHGGGGETG